MIEFRATVAIVRRHIDRRFGIDFAMAAALVALLAFVFAPSFDAAALPVLATLAAASIVEVSHIRSLRRLTFFTVPLFGRQLARAHAIAPAIGALALPLGYAVGARLRGVAIPPERIAVATCVVLVATLVALSATFRDGRDRALYVALAIAAGVSIAAAWQAKTTNPLAVAGGLAVVEGSFAVRAFGETLARYDPLPNEA